MKTGKINKECSFARPGGLEHFSYLQLRFSWVKVRISYSMKKNLIVNCSLDFTMHIDV